MPSSKTAYHHGHLRAACVRAGVELLEEGGQEPAVAIADDQVIARMCDMMDHSLKLAPADPNAFGAADHVHRAVGVPHQDALAFLNDVKPHTGISQRSSGIETGSRTLAGGDVSSGPEAPEVLRSEGFGSTESG